MNRKSSNAYLEHSGWAFEFEAGLMVERFPSSLEQNSELN